MKTTRIIAAVAAVLVLLCACGCNKVPAMCDVIAKIKTDASDVSGSFTLIPDAVEIDMAQTVALLGLGADGVKDACMLNSSAEGRSDAVAAVLTVDEESASAVSAAVYAYREAEIAKWRETPVNGSYERAKASVVLQRGNCVFYICVGRMPEDTEEELYFDEDIHGVILSVDSFFTQK